MLRPIRIPTSWLPCPKREPGNLNTNDELKKQAGTTAESSYCVEAIAFTKVSELLPWMRKFVEQKKSTLFFSTSTALEYFYGFSDILYSSSLVLFPRLLILEVLIV